MLEISGSLLLHLQANINALHKANQRQDYRQGGSYTSFYLYDYIRDTNHSYTSRLYYRILGQYCDLLMHWLTCTDYLRLTCIALLHCNTTADTVATVSAVRALRFSD